MIHLAITRQLLFIGATLLLPSLGFCSGEEPATATEDGSVEHDGNRSGGPELVENRLKDDAAPKTPLYRFDNLQRGLQPYEDFKKRLADDHGFSFGVDYSAQYFKTSESTGEDEAGSGMVRLYGSWELVGRGTPNVGKAVFKIEHRHGFTSTAPTSLGIASGYAGVWGGPFNDQGLRWTNLYWHQRLGEGKGNVLVGFLDMTDFLDVYALASPWTGFMNLAFSTGSAAIPLPGDAALGAMAGGFVNENVYLLAGVNDTNSDPTDVLEGFETFFDEAEHIYYAEVGYTPSYDQRYFDNTHVTVWGVDDRVAAATSDGWGVNFSYTKFIDDTWMPFVRGGYANDGGSLLSKSLSAGMGYYVHERADLFGIAVNWGEANEDTFGPVRDDQYTLESFYRIQLSPNFAITPDLQFIVDPALNPAADTAWVMGLRARLSL